MLKKIQRNSLLRRDYLILLGLITAILIIAVSGFASRAEENKETRITLSGNLVTVEGPGVTVSGNMIIIGSSGAYTVSGKADDGQILVDADGEVTLTLNGIDICSSYLTPIKNASKNPLNIIVADGTVNSLSDEYLKNTDSGACLYSKGDLYISGSGMLTINGNNKNGISSKHSVSVNGIELVINAASNAIKADGNITMNDMTLMSVSLKDGLKSDSSIVVSDCNIDITADDDCLQAGESVRIEGGDNKCRSYGKIVNCDGTVEGEDEIKIWF